MISNFILYIDPGPGSLLLQAVIAAITGAAFYITIARQRIKRFFQKHFNKKEPQEK